jgi:restriction system protein
MTLWLVRSGRYGEREDFALKSNVLAIGWEELSDLSAIKTREQLAALLKETYVEEKDKTVLNWTRQLWDFIHNIKVAIWSPCLPSSER